MEVCEDLRNAYKRSLLWLRGKRMADDPEFIRSVLEEIYPRETRVAGPEMLADLIDGLPPPVDTPGGARIDFTNISEVLANGVTIIVGVVEGVRYLRPKLRRAPTEEEIRTSEEHKIQRLLASQPALTEVVIRIVHTQQGRLR